MSSGSPQQSNGPPPSSSAGRRGGRGSGNTSPNPRGGRTSSPMRGRGGRGRASPSPTSPSPRPEGDEMQQAAGPSSTAPSGEFGFAGRGGPYRGGMMPRGRGGAEGRGGGGTVANNDTTHIDREREQETVASGSTSNPPPPASGTSRRPSNAEREGVLPRPLQPSNLNPAATATVAAAAGVSSLLSSSSTNPIPVAQEEVVVVGGKRSPLTPMSGKRSPMPPLSASASSIGGGKKSPAPPLSFAGAGAGKKMMPGPAVTLSPAAAAAAALVTASADPSLRRRSEGSTGIGGATTNSQLPPSSTSAGMPQQDARGEEKANTEHNNAAAGDGDGDGTDLPPPPLPPTPPKTPPTAPLRGPFGGPSNAPPNSDGAVGENMPLPSSSSSTFLPPGGGAEVADRRTSVGAAGAGASGRIGGASSLLGAGANGHIIPSSVMGTASCRIIIAIDPEITAGVDWRQNRLVVTVQMNQKLKHILQAVHARYRIDNVLEVSVPVSAKGKDLNSMQPVIDDVVQLDLTPLQLGWRPDSYNWVWFRTRQSPRDDIDPALQQITLKEWYLERVKRFYEFYDPRKLNTSESVLDDYDGSEDLLIVQLTGKYGREPTREMMRQSRANRMRGDLDATPQSILQDRVTGREKEDELAMMERQRQMELEQRKSGLQLQSKSGGGGKGSKRAGGVRAGGANRMASSDPELRRNLELLFARTDNDKSLRIIYFRKWFLFLSLKRARLKIAEFLSLNTATALYRTYYEKFKMFRIISTMGKQVTASNIAANKSDSLVSDLQSENTMLKGEVKKLQTQVELLDSTNARRLETLGNSSELAINQIRALTLECQTKEATIVKLEQKLMGIGNMALAAAEKKDFALKAAVAARLEMEDKLKAAAERATELEHAYQQAQVEIRKLKKKSELRKKLLGGSGALRRAVVENKIGSNGDDGPDEEISSSEDEGASGGAGGGRGGSGARSHGQHSSATIAAIQKECKHCIHYSQQKFVIDAHQRAADENRVRIDDLEKTLQRMQSVLNACEDENAELRRKLERAGGGGRGQQQPQQQLQTVNSPVSASEGASSPAGVVYTTPPSVTYVSHNTPSANPQSDNSKQQQKNQHNTPATAIAPTTTTTSSSAPPPPQSLPPMPASIRAILGDTAAAPPSMGGLQRAVPIDDNGAKNQNQFYDNMQRGVITNNEKGGQPNTSELNDYRHLHQQQQQQGKLLVPFKTYDGSSNPTWGYGMTTAVPQTLVRDDPLPNNASAPPRLIEHMLTERQRAVNEAQRELDNQARSLLGGRGKAANIIADEFANPREAALLVGPKLGRSDLAGKDLTLHNFFSTDAAIAEEKMKLQLDRQLSQARVGLLPHERDKLVKAREAERRAILDHGMGVGVGMGASTSTVLADRREGEGAKMTSSHHIDTNKTEEKEAGAGADDSPSKVRHINSGHYVVKHKSSDDKLSASTNTNQKTTLVAGTGSGSLRGNSAAAARIGVSSASSMPYRFYDPSAAPVMMLNNKGMFSSSGGRQAPVVEGRGEDDPLASVLGISGIGMANSGKRSSSSSLGVHHSTNFINNNAHYSHSNFTSGQQQQQQRGEEGLPASGSTTYASATNAAMSLILGLPPTTTNATPLPQRSAGMGSSSTSTSAYTHTKGPSSHFSALPPSSSLGKGRSSDGLLPPRGVSFPSSSSSAYPSPPSVSTASPSGVPFVPPSASSSAAANMLALMKERMLGLGGDVIVGSTGGSHFAPTANSNADNNTPLVGVGDELASSGTIHRVAGERPPQTANKSRYNYTTAPTTQGSASMKSVLFNYT